jgi:hypothetical protein
MCFAIWNFIIWNLIFGCPWHADWKNSLIVILAYGYCSFWQSNQCNVVPNVVDFRCKESSKNINSWLTFSKLKYRFSLVYLWQKWRRERLWEQGRLDWEELWIFSVGLNFNLVKTLYLIKCRWFFFTYPGWIVTSLGRIWKVWACLQDDLQNFKSKSKLCWPRTTTEIGFGDVWQWAAVKTYLLLIKVPPQS